jgi:hypothetical protein
MSKSTTIEQPNSTKIETALQIFYDNNVRVGEKIK